jgi:hypothetical protein
MEVTEYGIIIDVNTLHPLKEQSPMEVTDSGIVIDVNPLQ